MPQYSCHFLTSTGDVFCAEDIDGASADHALEKVRQLCGGLEQTPAFELWCGTVRVHAEAGKTRNGTPPAFSAPPEARGCRPETTMTVMPGDSAVAAAGSRNRP